MDTFKVRLTKNAIGFHVSGSSIDIEPLIEAFFQLDPYKYGNDLRLKAQDSEHDRKYHFYLYMFKKLSALQWSTSLFTIRNVPVVPHSKIKIKKLFRYTLFLAPHLLSFVHVCLEYLKYYRGDNEYRQIIIHFTNTVLEAIKRRSKRVHRQALTWLSTHSFGKDYAFNLIFPITMIYYVEDSTDNSRLYHLPTVLFALDENTPLYSEILKACEDCDPNQLHFPYAADLYNQLTTKEIEW